MQSTNYWTVDKITDNGAMADRQAFTATVTWHDVETGARTDTVTFTGPAPGFPGVVVMVIDPDDPNMQHYVSEPSRFGEFGEQWVRNFYGVSA